MRIEKEKRIEDKIESHERKRTKRGREKTMRKKQESQSARRQEKVRDVVEQA